MFKKRPEQSFTKIDTVRNISDISGIVHNQNEVVTCGKNILYMLIPKYSNLHQGDGV